MALYALRKTSDNSILRLREFSAPPPVLSPAKGMQWFPYTPPPPPPPTPEELARQAAVVQFQADRTETLAYNKLTALSNMTPTQIGNYFGPPRYPGPAANLAEANALLAKLNDDLTTLAVGLSVLIRRERLNILG